MPNYSVKVVVGAILLNGQKYLADLNRHSPHGFKATGFVIPKRSMPESISCKELRMTIQVSEAFSSVMPFCIHTLIGNLLI